MRELSIRKSIFKVILLIVFLCMAGGCLVLGIKAGQMVSDNVFILSFQQENQKFRESDIADAENNGICLTYIKRLYPEVSNGFRTEEAEVLATNDNYIHFSGLELVKGTFFNQKQIIQMDLYKAVFMQRFLMVPILAGGVLFFVTLKEMLETAKMIAQKGMKDRKCLTKFVSELLICAVSFLLIGKMIQLFWCVPPNYELIGKNFRDGFYTILEFYSLSCVELDNMYILNEWNLLSMLLSVGSVLIFGMWLAGKVE